VNNYKLGIDAELWACFKQSECIQNLYLSVKFIKYM